MNEKLKNSLVDIYMKIIELSNDKLGSTLINANTNYRAFISTVTPSYQWNWHLELIANKLDKLINGDITNIAISIPPQHGKTEIAVRHFIPYLFGRLPNEKVLFLTHSLNRAYAESREIQRLMTTNIYKAVFPYIDILKDQNKDRGDLITVSRFNVKSFEGYFIASSLNSGSAGETATTVIIDDPIKNRQEGMNVKYLNELYSNYLANVRTRQGIYRTEELKQVVIHTRWHEEDLIGKLLKNEPDNWEYIKLEAIRTNEPRDYDPRQEGEPIWNDKLNIKKLNDLRVAYGDVIFEALYQQQPIKLEGNYFDINNLQFYDYEITPEYTIMTVDLAISQKETADYTAVCVAKISDGKLFIEEVYRNRVRGDEIINYLTNIRNYHNVDIVGVERTQYQLAIIHQLLANNIPTIELYPRGDKLARTEPTLSLIGAGKILFNSRMKNKNVFLRELSEFPNSPHDDQIDVLNYAVEYFLKRKIQKPNIRMFKL